MKHLLWNIVQDRYDRKDKKKYETQFTLGNGYKGLRGVLEFSKPGECGNLVAGIFDKSKAQVTEIVNLQNPLVFNIYIDDELIDLDICEIINFKRSMNMKQGVLYTEVTVKTNKGKQLKISAERFVSRSNVHRWAARYSIVPINFSGKLFVENIIDGSMTNNTSDPFQMVKHFNVIEAYNICPGIALRTKTKDKGTEVIEASTLISGGSDGNFFKGCKYGEFGEKVREIYEAYVVQNKEYVIEKFGVTYTTRDCEADIFQMAKQEMDTFIKDGYQSEKEAHIQKWNSIWNNIDIEISGDDEAQVSIRFNLFHLAAAAYDEDERVSVAAKGLHGEGYKGHIFWDTETFMLPFFIYSQPSVAKALLMYRYNTLAGARENARGNGYKGAQFPWESADDGTEVTPKWGFDYDGNPVRIWTGDEEFHINSDITYGIWQYFRVTGDEAFLKDYGLEIFLDTSKFWQSRVEYNSQKDRYEINRVIGPDEFHEHVNNNVYTNYLAKWSIKKTLGLIEWIRKEDKLILNKLFNKLCITEEDIQQWNTIQEKMFIPRSKDGRLIEQFEGYFSLPDVEVTDRDENGMPLWPELNGIKFQDTQLIKQADVVMLMLMLGDEIDENAKIDNYSYYEKRTMHKSSLSPSMYSIMGLNVGDTKNAYRYFIKTVMTDLNDNQGNTDLGLHAASAGGSWQSAIFGFGGVKIDNNGVLSINPWIPEKWEKMNFNLLWKGAKVGITVTQKDITIESVEDLQIKINNNLYTLEKNSIIAIKR